MSEIRAWISRDSDRVGVVGVLNVYRTDNEDEILYLDITESEDDLENPENHWVNLTDFEGDFINNYGIFEVLNVKAYQKYIAYQLVDGESIYEIDFSEDFLKKIQKVLKENEVTTILNNENGMVDLNELNNEYRLFSKDNDFFMDIKESFLEALKYEVEALKNDIPQYNSNMSALKDMLLVDDYEKILSGKETMVETDFLKSLTAVMIEENELVHKEDILEKYVSNNVGFVAGDTSRPPALEVFNVGTKQEYTDAINDLEKANSILEYEQIKDNYYRLYIELSNDFDVENAYELSRILKHHGEKDFIDPNTLEVKDYRDYQAESELNLDDKKFMELIEGNVCYSHETKEASPVLEVFKVGGSEFQAMAKAEELKKDIKEISDNPAFQNGFQVDYGMFNNDYYHLMVYVDADMRKRDMYQISKVLKDYGDKEWVNFLGYEHKRKISIDEIESWVEDEGFEFTSYIEESIYILPDGQMISGDYEMGIRGTDHGMIESLLESELNYNAFQDDDFWSKVHDLTGVVRYVPETNVGLIATDQQLTDKQSNVLVSAGATIELYCKSLNKNKQTTIEKER